VNEDEGKIIWGLLICWGLNLLNLVLSFFLGGSASNIGVLFVLVGGIGLIQLLYVIPLYISFKKSGKTDTAKGMVIAASITALLNATCWGMFLGR
jgi:hypothetical protein